MRLAGAVLTCLVAVSFAIAEPAKQAVPAKAAATKTAPAKKEAAKAKKATKATKATKGRQEGRDGRDRGLLCGDPPYRAPFGPERPRLDRRLQRRHQRRIRRAGDRGREGVPEAQWRQGDRRAQSAGARRARRRRQAEAGRSRLAHGRRPDDRRASRHSDQVGAEHAFQRWRWQMELVARRVSVETFRITQPGTTLPRVRADEEGAGRPQA